MNEEALALIAPPSEYAVLLIKELPITPELAPELPIAPPAPPFEDVALLLIKLLLIIIKLEA